MRLVYLLVIFLLGSCTQSSSSQTVSGQPSSQPAATPVATAPIATSAEELTIGAAQISQYLPHLSGKRVGMVVNHTSLVGNTHLVDTLLSLQVPVKKIFAPEHGFRGDADAGEHVSSGVDKKTNLPLISLYGSNKKPTAEQLADLDVVVFDIQDVGTRFYTYISTMHYVMEACAENNKKLLILDRPNPHGSYFDGPVLKPAFKSFVGMHPIPVVHGLTVGELANMINGQKWLANGVQCDVTVIKNKNYTHHTPYTLPVRPSPNLSNQQAIRLYPSLCLFEGTVISVGRGTDFPFQMIGSPNPANGSFTFTPKSVPGAKNPPYLNQLCYGLDLREDTLSHFSLKYLIDFYQKAANKDKFFNSFFEKLAGNDQLRNQIKSGMTEAQIRETWKEDLTAYKALRKQYLLYAE
ncbi:DUF1343 domain-containing protein [Rhodocytophaga aerolata]|uniref:DUF1343 domain-containing protein n=1 Tax=Rhodocytophaga aerolata TaxID=455078 RepID=A0ABT8R128_9BACT|nr:DUF1343 domain-containing protein [Rhodocytophaga aerolata]MDO1445624.1 DUF1343 domain-containing protein [Rhodocytophaga aerolata]